MEPLRKRNAHFTKDRMDAGEALNRAHFLAFAPFAFEAARILRDSGTLALLDDSGDNGATTEAVEMATGFSPNAAQVLLEAGLGTGLVACDGARFYLTMAGQYFLQHAAVRANTDFMRDVCLPGIGGLSDSLRADRPCGLERFGGWKNIFEALPHLPPAARNSWYAFNNHHSDGAFRDALPLVLAAAPKRILDLGGSTGRFALAALDRDAALHVGIAELQPDDTQLEPGVPAAIREGRITLHHLDVLAEDAGLPEGYDAIWMSQFLPCFSEEQIAAILSKCRVALPEDGSIWLLETFWDRQRHEAAAAALQLTSLYFVNVATGVSRMYRSDELLKMIGSAGFTVASEKDGLGRGHTLMRLRRT